MALYHYTIGFPSYVQIPILKLTYSRHAQHASQTDRYGAIVLPNNIAQNAKLIEIEVEHGKVQKYVLRQVHCQNYDIVIVVLASGLVKTVWLNSRNDTHKTLKKHLYSTP